MDAKITSLRVLIADDHELVRRGLRQLLQQWNPGIEVVEAEDGTQLEAWMERDQNWQLVLVDLIMPRFDSLPAIQSLITRFPSTPFVAISGSDCPHQMKQLLDYGIAGFVPKATDGDLIIKVMELVLAGGRYIPSAVLDGANPLPVTASTVPPSGDITERQQDILDRLRRGLPNKVIASQLGITEATVKMHVTGLLKAHGVRSRAELIVRYH